MTVTKTLGAIQVINTLSIGETIAFSGDPTFAGDLSGTVAAGQQWRMDGTVGKSVTKVFHGLVALVAGAKTLDLTALTDAVLGTVDFSGLKLRLLHAVATSGNTAAISIAPGASNGYTGWVGSSGLLLQPGDSRGPDLFTGGIAIDGTHKTIDLAGTGTESVTLIMGFGP
jgi:hypothetical protein